MPFPRNLNDASNPNEQKPLSGFGSGWKVPCTLEVVMAHSYKSTSGDQPGVSGKQMFQTLEFKGSRQRTFWASVGFHGVMLTVLVILPLLFTGTIKIKYDTVLLAPPPPEKRILEVTHYKQPPQPKPEPRPVEKLVAPPPVKPLLVEPPKLEKPPEPLKIAEVKLPEVIEREKPLPLPRLAEPDPGPAAPAPRIEVRTGAFSTGSSAKPTVDLPARDVQTGGFGDPNGIPGVGKPGKIANIASLGAFDLPVGAGAGNGTGGAKGVKGVVASTGFGNGVAPVGNGGGGGGGGNGGGGSGRNVRQGGFGDADAAKPEAAPRKRDLGPPQTPVEIISKPRPDYTDEARKLKLEGEVLLRVLFTAAGEVRVLDVVRGLGRGLDENAIRAAQQIKFKPAQRDGQPVDSTATVHIVFQLAY
jgi:TonB family protein